MPRPEITTLFLDIGGVLLTNGWDQGMRRQAAETFGLDFQEMNERHHLTFDTYEAGKLSLDEYLNRTVFHQKTSCTRDEFKEFMLSRSQPYPEMIRLLHEIKERHRLKLVAVNNEGRELSSYRARKFALAKLVDFFVSSCFVHYRKPDEDIYRMALDLAQVEPAHVLYIEDRALFVEVAESLGIRSVRHAGFQSTKEALSSYGLE